MLPENMAASGRRQDLSDKKEPWPLNSIFEFHLTAFTPDR
jgi:hypothetical protein